MIKRVKLETIYKMAKEDNEKIEADERIVL